MALGMKISRRSAARIVKNDLATKSFKRKQVHFITPQIKAKRVTSSKGLLKRHAVHADKILFSDEKLFTLEEATDSQNDRIIVTSVSTITEEVHFIGRLQNPLSVMVYADLPAIKRKPLIFVPLGVEINSISYQELILEPVVNYLNQTMFSGKSSLSARWFTCQYIK